MTLKKISTTKSVHFHTWPLHRVNKYILDIDSNLIFFLPPQSFGRCALWPSSDIYQSVQTSCNFELNLLISDDRQRNENSLCLEIYCLVLFTATLL